VRHGRAELLHFAQRLPGHPPASQQHRRERRRQAPQEQRPKARHGRVTRLEGGAPAGAARARRPFSLGKLAVVLGAWAVSKLGRGERKAR